MFLREAHSLMSGTQNFYSPRHMAGLVTIAAPCTFLCDQPERTKATRIMNVIALFHTRFRYSIHHKALLDILCLCNLCIATIRAEAGYLRVHCQSFCTWDPTGAMSCNVTYVDKLKAPKDCPVSHFGSEESLRP